MAPLLRYYILVCLWQAHHVRLCTSFSGSAELGVKRSSHCKPLLGLLLGWAYCAAAIAGQCLLLFYAELGGKRSSLCRPAPAFSCLLWHGSQPVLTTPLVFLYRPPTLHSADFAAFCCKVLGCAFACFSHASLHLRKRLALGCLSCIVLPHSLYVFPIVAAALAQEQRRVFVGGS